MDKMINKEKACCFTGHRKIDPQVIEDLHKRLSNAIEGFIGKGITTFLAGGALGFDTLAALTVLDKRNIYPEVRLILCLPCPEQAHRWSESDKDIYNDIIKRADEVIYTRQSYTKGCMHERNRYMVDNSSYCLAYCTDPTAKKGGTVYTLRYAEKKSIRVLNFGMMQ